MSTKCYLNNKPSDEKEWCVKCYYRGKGLVCNLGKDVNCFAWNPIGMFLAAKKWSKQLGELYDNQLIHPMPKDRQG